MNMMMLLFLLLLEGKFAESVHRSQHFVYNPISKCTCVGGFSSFYQRFTTRRFTLPRDVGVGTFGRSDLDLRA
jgi:hypothetical protein